MELLTGGALSVVDRGETTPYYKSISYKIDFFGDIWAEYARKSFQYMGSKVYNELPLDIRRTRTHLPIKDTSAQHITLHANFRVLAPLDLLLNVDYFNLEHYK